MPQKGEVIGGIKGFEFEVLQADSRQIKRVKIKRIKQRAARKPPAKKPANGKDGPTQEAAE